MLNIAALSVIHVFMALDLLKCFLRFKDVTNACECLQNSQTFSMISSIPCNKLEDNEGLKCVFFILCCLSESK